MLNFKSWIDVTLYVIQIIGCISFATSGAITAIRKKADILGIYVLTLISIFGGGILRDLFINQGAPHILWDSEYLIMAGISLVITTIWFLIAYFPKTANIVEKHRHDMWIYVIDAIGIAVFCVYGVQAAANALPESADIVGRFIYIVVLGVVSGVGGGMFRDVFIGEIPMVFKKHFYMTPCILGCTIYAILYMNNIDSILSIIIGVIVIVGLRVAATIFKWNLPSAKAYNELTSKKQD